MGEQQRKKTKPSFTASPCKPTRQANLSFRALALLHTPGSDPHGSPKRRRPPLRASCSFASPAPAVYPCRERLGWHTLCVHRLVLPQGLALLQRACGRRSLLTTAAAYALAGQGVGLPFGGRALPYRCGGRLVLLSST